MQKEFVFDLNKCTGCNACQIACSIENEVELPLNWRQINTFNEHKHPQISYFHLSTACNHCLDPPCLKYCPALAIHKIQDTGAVIIDENKCIACKYCSWVCPYDAPVYNPSAKTMEKCTFCQHRLEENLLPACVTLCPTSALTIADHQEGDLPEPVLGFTESEIKPAIRFTPLSKDHELPEISELPFDEITMSMFRESLGKVKTTEKIRFLPEWPLVIFSLLIAFVTGSLTANALLPSGSPGIYSVILGFFGLGISSIHLGKKFRAPRAILNLKNSWLSREIAFYALFVTILTGQVFIFSDISWLSWITIGTGFLTLYFMDKVYTVIATVHRQNYHSANVLLTGLFLASIFSEFMFGIILFGSIKFILYIRQLLNHTGHLNFLKYLYVSLRILLGFIVPSVIWFLEISGVFTYCIILILIAEFIDRCQFYENLKIITPAKQMAIDLEELLNER